MHVCDIPPIGERASGRRSHINIFSHPAMVDDIDRRMPPIISRLGGGAASPRGERKKNRECGGASRSFLQAGRTCRTTTHEQNLPRFVEQNPAETVGSAGVSASAPMHALPASKERDCATFAATGCTTVEQGPTLVKSDTVDKLQSLDEGWALRSE